MKIVLLILSFLGVFALAQGLQEPACQCPQVKCPGDDAVALCQCLNGREKLCKDRCPSYVPTYLPCPAAPPTGTPSPKPPKPTVTGKPAPAPCKCDEIYCLQAWPASCHCNNEAARLCYEKCGGEKPVEAECPNGDVQALAAASQTKSEPEPEPEIVSALEVKGGCTCEQAYCIQMYPESCYCANAAAEKCYAKCGGIKPELEKCPPPAIKTLQTKTKTPKPTSTKPPQPINTHKVCGGFRSGYQSCDEGDVCIVDPYTPGCGPPCDGLGICVKDKLCGGFAGFACQEEGQVCHDDPRDDCDPKKGGADCGGLCIWPHKPLYETDPVEGVTKA